MRTDSSGVVTNEQVRNQYIQNLLLERSIWLRSVLDPRRNIDAECGHPVSLEIKDYLGLYRRGDAAARVVRVWPEESWAERPFIYETEDPVDTEFETAWLKLEEELALLPLLFRADVLSGIGQFGVILLGMDDGGSLDTVLPGVGENGLADEVSLGKNKLLYVRVFDQSVVTIDSWENRIQSPRYGLPMSYTIQYENSVSQRVHWSRIIHVADNRMSSEVYGQPRMEVVINRLLDLAKVAGGSGEMFWKGGFPGISLETLPEVMNNNNVEIDKEATKAQMEAYMNGLQRYIATVGMKANSLSVQVADPGPHLEAQLKLIAIALSIPWRVFVGSEAAQLASEQDIRTWNRRVSRRRHDYLTPFIIRPFVQRLIAAGALPLPKNMFVVWSDLNTPSEKDRAAVAEGLTNALTQYVASGVDVMMPPYHFLTLVMKMTPAEAQSVIESANSGVEQIEGLEDAREAQQELESEQKAKTIPASSSASSAAE